jgi:SAM-dependent methyltransferase
MESMAPSILYSDILTAIKKVEEAFPFKGYITKGKRKGMIDLAQQLDCHLKGEGGRLLDIGSGPMETTAVFAQLGYECCAVDDLSDPWHRRNDNLEAIIQFSKQMGIDFHLQSYDDYSIPFLHDSFDIVILNAVIEHLHESPRNILNTAGSFLRTDGLICVTMPNSVNLRKRLSVLRGLSNYPPIDQFFHCCGRWRGHVREYTLGETVYICKMAGYEVLTATTFEEIAYDRLGGLVLQLYLLLCQIIPTCRSALCVIARKPKNWTPVKEDAKAYREAIATSVPPGVQ